MYDTTIPNSDLDARIQSFAVAQANLLIAGVDAGVVKCMGGEDQILRRSLRMAEDAREALTLTPRDRLTATVTFWLNTLRHAVANPVPPDNADDPEDVDESELMLLCDKYVLTRVEEIHEYLKIGDIDKAFALLRTARVARPHEEHPVMLPESLEIDSAYWLDLTP
jgi:hypothetical protein